MAKGNILEALTAAPQADTRPHHTFKIPEKSRVLQADPKSLTFVPLRIQDEQDAMKVAESAGGNLRALQAELIRRAVVAIDGKPVDWSAGGDGWLEKCGPKVRQLAYLAYVKVNDNEDDEKKDFLGSEAVEV